jgi:ligand-binding sensor domain-containing protein/two-component sensor histidine kinase
VRIRYCYLLICLLLLPFVGLTQQYNFRNYNVEDGLGQSQVYAAHQDKMGNLWLGTRGGGISVFDGFEFKSYTDQDGLPNNIINDIEEDSKNRIWIGTNSGLCFYDGKNFTTIDFGDLQSAVVRDIFITEADQIFLATNKGIFKVINNRASQIGKEVGINELQSTSIWVDLIGNQNKIWIGTDKGLYSFYKGKKRIYKEESRYMGNAITTLTKDADGKLWIGTYGDGMYCHDGDSFYRIDFHHELYRKTVLDIYSDSSQNLWVATLRSGVIHYNRSSKTFTSISENEGLSNNHIRCIIQDHNDNFWFGTSGGGICHYLGKQFTNYDSKSGLAGNFIYSVFRDRKNQLWVGNSQKGVSVFTGKEVLNFHGGNGFKNVKVKAIGEDKNGNIWLGTDGNGVYVYKDEKFTLIEELKRAYVKQIKADKQGNIWIATAGTGIVKISDQNGNYLVENWMFRDGLLSNRITSLHFDKRDRLWYGTTDNGVGCLDKNQKTIVHLKKDEHLSSNFIRSLTEDKNGRLWVGTAGSGICAYDLYKNTKKKRFLTQNQGLKSNNVYLLTTDNDGNIIVGTEKGLDYIYLNKDGSQKQIKHYGKLDGFTGVETCQNSVWTDKNGSIWFGTINGLCKFNPSELVKNVYSPILSFKDIKLFYESILGDEENALEFGKQRKPLLLSYDQNHITFEFLGINMKRPEGVMYKWKLAGFDEEWSPASKDRSILYSNLNPGNYRFLLKASNEDGVWNEKALEYTFEIETPYWKTVWFKVLIGLGILLVLLAIYKIGTNRVRRKALLQQREVEFEMEVLELEQKAMRLQMNPHFIFNALNSIQSLIGTGDETKARYFLAKFSRLMRQILDNSRKTEITLEEEISTLENYLLIEQFCNGGRFEYTVEMDKNMESDFINIPPMLIQPFVENAIKHGMKGKTDKDDKGQINLKFVETGGILKCVIEDNGIGRKAAEEINKASKETYHTSAGLSVTEDRLRKFDMGGTIKPLEIIDLYEDGKATGTRVIIRLPID